MQVALKIWRYDPIAGERALKEYEVSAPEEATLLDVLDIVKDQVDGSLAYRKSCRMMICGSCGMRMDGAAVLACKTRMYDVAQEGRVPVISAMGNLPVVKDLVVDMGPFWGKIRAVTPWLEPGYSDPGETEHVVSQERCPKGVDPRDAIAKLGAEAVSAGIDSDMGAKHAKWFVTSAKTTGWLRETELVPKTQGVVKAIKEIKFAMSLLPKGKVPPPFPPHVAADVGESRALFDLVKTQGRDGAA